MSIIEQIVQDGYKQTEVGIIPLEWHVLKVDDFSLKVGSGKTPTGGASVYVDSGRPFVRSQNVGSGNLRLSDLAYITEETHSTFTGSEIKTDDVLLNITGASIGRCALASPMISGGNVNQHVCIIRTNSAKVHPYLLQTLINSDTGQQQIDSYQAGGNREGLNFSQVRNMQFAFSHDIKEQTAIANALSDVDALITELEKLIAKKQAIKTATMQQLLTGKTRLPQFAIYTEGEKQGQPKGTKTSELGAIPKDWDVKTIGESCDVLTGFPFPSKKYCDSGIRLLRGSNVKRGETDWSSEITQYWPEITPNIKEYELRVGDIVVSMDGSLVGKSYAQLSKEDLPAVLLQRVARIRSESIEVDYLKEWVCSKFFTNHCDSVKTVTAIPHISPIDIKSFRLLVPSEKEEQIAIATILSDMDSEIQILEQRLSKTRQVKQGMMQELLTGRTRLPF